MVEKTVAREQVRGLTGICLAVLFILLLIGASFLILLPFLPALIWAIMIVISTWPLMIQAQARLGSRNKAALLMVFGMFLVFIVPLFLAVSTILENSAQITNWVHYFSSFERPAPPEWLTSIPIIGPRIAKKWILLSAENKDDLIARATPYMGKLTTWFIAQLGNIGMLVIHFFLTIILSGVLYVRGEAGARTVTSFATRLAGSWGNDAVVLAAQAIRAVAVGVVGTALLQSLLAGAAFAVAGVPQAVILTAFSFFLGIIQIGTVPVMLAVVIWLFSSGSTGWGIAMLIWTALVGVTDNFIRPILIRRGANLPLLLIFAGVIGGLIGFGIIGLFVGPVVLAVTYTLLNAWIAAPER